MRNFEDLIKGKEKFTIAYVGGSITEKIYWPQDIKYPSELVRRLNEKYRETEFVELNAATGGTRSDLGLFKLSYDVFRKNPDMLFIEYSVNDNGDKERMYKYYENIIRESLKWKPDLPIVIVFAYTQAHFADGRSRQNPPEIYVKHREIGDAYGIHCIDMASDLFEAIQRDGDNGKYTSDNVHANDLGHTIYTDTIMRELFDIDFDTIRLIEKPMYGVEFNNPRIIPCESMTLPEGWGLSTTRTLWQSDLHYAYSDKPGAALEFEFEGSHCGLYLRIEQDGGYADIYLDGKYLKKTTFWDGAALYFNRNAFDLLADDLEEGKHTVKVVIREDKAEQSEGHVARIAGLLVG